MKFKYKGKEIEVPDGFIIQCGQHAESRGMTLEDYIAEAFTMLEAQRPLATTADWGYDANGSPTKETSCGGTPSGWVSEDEFQADKLKNEGLNTKNIT